VVPEYSPILLRERALYCSAFISYTEDDPFDYIDNLGGRGMKRPHKRHIHEVSKREKYDEKENHKR
jgi:hypothetical protein